MPGTAISLKPFQDQRSGLPGPLQKVLDTIFPLDDPTMGISPAPMMAVQAPASLVQALSPLAKGSLQRGSELAQELAGRAGEYATRTSNARYGTPAYKLASFLNKTAPEAIDPNKVAALSKTTGTRPPTRQVVDLPENFTTRRVGTEPRRNEKWDFSYKGQQDPIVDRLRKIWSSYENAINARRGSNVTRTIDRPPLSSLSGEKPALSGKWGPRNPRRGGSDLKNVAAHNKEKP